MEKKCIFLTLPLMDFGGQERFVSRLTTILKDTYELKLIIFDDTVIGYPIDCDYFSLNISPFLSRKPLRKVFKIIKKIFSLRRLMTRYQPYASVSFGTSANFFNILAGAGKCQTIISIRGYSGLYKLKLNNSRGYFSRLLYSRANKIICVTNLMADELKQIIPAQKDKICRLYNAYNIEEINKFAQQENELASWFAENEVIVAVGTLRSEKGYWHLIKAFSVLKKTRNRVKLLHIGAEHLDNGPKLNQLIQNLGLVDDVVLLGYRENPFKYCSRSRGFVLSSVSEGFPNVLVEAMACGVPVIAADCKTGPREILSEANYQKVADDIEFADYGILIPPLTRTENYNPEVIEECDRKLAEAIDLLLNNEELAKKYAIKAKERASDYSYERCKQEIIKIIEQEVN
ncbi:MAG: glycosyltransferase [Desulfosporosinus sp.]|nr:glycosyltransferase [Desulfosporosinus sp.]